LDKLVRSLIILSDIEHIPVPPESPPKGVEINYLII
jgi:hypothetical protein